VSIILLLKWLSCKQVNGKSDKSDVKCVDKGDALMRCPVEVSRRKRNAVGLKSGKAVDYSAPVQSQPTGPQTAGLKPEAPFFSAKSGRGVGQSPTATDSADSFEWDQESIDRLIAFFRLLDEWERKRDEEENL